MQELIQVTTNGQGQQVVSARDLHEYLDLDKSQISRWLKSNIVENKFLIENYDYEGFDIYVEGNLIKDYFLSINCAKRISMMSKSKKGEEIRNYFIECERLAKSQLPTTYIDALKALVASEEAKEKALLEVGNLNTVLDNLLDWVSIIKIAQFNKVSEKHFDWRRLKNKSNELGFAIKKAESPRYGYQNLYHITVFKACYPKFNYDIKH